MVLRHILQRFLLAGFFAALLGALPLGPSPTTIRAFLGQVPPQEKQNQSEENDDSPDVTAQEHHSRHNLRQQLPENPHHRIAYGRHDDRPARIACTQHARRSRELPRRTAPPAADDDPDEPALS